MALSPGTDHTDVLVSAYAALHGLVVERPDVPTVLRRAVSLAADVVPGTACGITMQRGDETGTVAGNNDLAERIDEIQYRHGQGPCLDALRTGETVYVADLVADERWRDYRSDALERGVRSSLGVPFAVNDAARGALNLYAFETHRFEAGVAARVEAFVGQLVTSLTLVLRDADQAALEAQLREALATRAVIDQAVGIVMARQRVNAVTAFDLLREASQHRNRKLRDLAADLVQSITGEPPTPPRPFADPR